MVQERLESPEALNPPILAQPDGYPSHQSQPGGSRIERQRRRRRLAGREEQRAEHPEPGGRRGRRSEGPSLRGCRA